MFNIIGYTYGRIGDDFKVPDMTNLFVTGAGGAYGIGTTGGSADAVVVSHSHGITQNDHDHSVGGNVGFGGDNVAFGLGYDADGGTTSGGQADITIDSEGVPGTNKNLPPYIALYYIIRIQ